MFKKLSRSQVRRIFVVTMIALVAVMGSLSLIRTQALTNTVKVQIDKGGGTDNTQETTFNFLVKNVTTTAVSGISARVYFTPDGSNAASGYVLEKYYDQSGVATISGPTLLSGTTYYFTINYGTASLAAGAQWEFQTALHLSSWGSTYNGGNDYYHTGYAVGALPAAYTDTNYITAYTSGTLAWGTEPGGTGSATNTFVPPTTAVPTTITPSVTPSKTSITPTNGGTASCPPRPTNTATVTPSGSATPMPPAGDLGWFNLTGTVISSSGAPLAGATVSYSNTGIAANPPASGTVTTAADGSFCTPMVFIHDTNTVSVTASAPGYASQTIKKDGVTASTNRTYNFTLSPAVTLTGTGASITPSSQPDLTVSSINSAPPTVPCGTGWNPGTFVTVTNSGTVNVGSFVVSLSNAGGTPLTATVTSLPAGQSVTVFFNQNGGQLTATVDSTNVIAESNETNNSLSKTLPVSDPLMCTFTPTPPANPQADLVVTRIWFGPQPSPCQASQGLNITVANNGTANAGSFVLRVTVGTGAPIDQTVSGLAAGQSVVVAFLNASQFGSITATADATNLIAESNETNNSLTTSLPALTQPPACTFTPTPSTPTKTFTPSATPTAGSNITVTGTITDVCGNGIGIKGVQMWVGVITGTLKKAGNVSTGTGSYSIDFSVAGVTGIDGKTVVVMPHLNGWVFTPNYSSWVHPAGTVENKVINFTATSGGSGCSATATNTVTALGTPTPWPTNSPGNTPYTLEGFVYDASSLAPLSGATVSNNSTCTPHAALNAFADANGFYSLTVPAIYACGSITASATGYTTFSDPQSVSQIYANGVTSYFLTKGSVTNTPTPVLGTCTTSTCNVSIVNFAFQPANLTVSPPGASVTWTNTGTVNHTVTADNGSFDSGPLAPGQTFTINVSIGTQISYHCSIHTSMTGTILVPSDPTPVPTKSATPTPTGSAPPPTKTFTPTATKTNTPVPTSSGNDPCASATTITGGGTFSVGTTTTCFKYVNTSFVNGGMFSVMKDGTSASDTIKWYGGMDQNATSCTNQSSSVSGNGGQLNNFTVAKDANGQMFLIVTGSASNSITLSIQNWQNGAGCSVKPTVHP